MEGIQHVDTCAHETCSRKHLHVTVCASLTPVMTSEAVACRLAEQGGGGGGALERRNRAGVRTRGLDSCRTIKVGVADAQTKPRVKVCVSRRGVCTLQWAHNSQLLPLGVCACVCVRRVTAEGRGRCSDKRFPGREGVKHGTHI